MKRPFDKVQVATISLAHLAHDTYSSFLAPILPLLIDKLDLSLSQASLLDIARKIPALFNPFLGLLAERTDARYFVIATPAVTAIAMTLLGVADSYAMLFFLLVIAGISATLFHIPAPGIVKVASAERVGFGMSCFMVGGEMARTLGPLLVTAGVSMWGLEGIWRLMPFGLVASAILYWRLRDFRIDKSFLKKPERGDTGKVLRQVTPFFLLIGGYMLFQSGMKIVMTLYLPVYLTQQGFGLWYAGIALSVLQFFGVIGTFLSGTVSDRIGRRRTLLISGAAAAVFMWLFIHSMQPLTIFLTLSLTGLFMFATGPVLLALVHDLKTQMPTFVNSLYMGINFGISSAVVFGMGYLGDTIGLVETYKIAVILAFCALPLAWFIQKGEQV